MHVSRRLQEAVDKDSRHWEHKLRQRHAIVRHADRRAKAFELCRRFEIDNSHRDLHGALVDADLLTEVYIELLGGRQPDLSLDDARAEQQGQQPASETPLDQSGFSIQRDASQFSRPHMSTDAELSAHEDFLQKIEDPIWKQ